VAGYPPCADENRITLPATVKAVAFVIDSLFFLIYVLIISLDGGRIRSCLYPVTRGLTVMFKNHGK